MTYQEYCKNDRDGRGSRGFILFDVILALSIGALFVAIISDMSMTADVAFHRAHDRASLIDMYYSIRSGSSTGGPRSSIHYPIPYGNDMQQQDIVAAIGSSTLSVSSVTANPSASLIDVAGTPLCSVDFGNGSSLGGGGLVNVDLIVERIILPISAYVGAGAALTDIAVRHGIAYISADSALASDPDIFIVDISSSTSPHLRVALDTGPGIAAFSLAGRRVYAAAASTAAQLHIIRIDSLDSLSLETKFKLLLPYATSTSPVGSAIFYRSGNVYLGTEKWDGDEFSIIDVSKPGQAIRRSGLDMNGKVASIFARDGMAYVGAAGDHQLSTIDVHDSTHPTMLGVLNPSGWQRQQGQSVSMFEGSLVLGRTSGGYDIATDHELFARPAPSASFQSTNMPGGVYGLVIDRRNIYAATRQSGGMVEAFDRATLQPVATYGLSASPRAMTCDGKHIYAIASGAPYLYDIHPKDIF